MPRPKGSKNRPKTEIEAEKARRAATKASGSASAGVGHNSDLTEQELQSRFVIGLTEIERLKGDQEGVTAKIRNERKRIMAYGFTRAQIDFALELRKAKPEDAVADWRRLMLAARFINHPIGTQPDMFAESDAVDDSIKRAEQSGYHAGLEGGPCKPPMASDSPEGQAWIEQWHKGVAARNTAMNDAVQATEPKPPADADDAFDDAMPNAADDASEGNAPEAAAATPEEQAAGRKAFRDALREEIKAGDDLNRSVEEEKAETA